MRQSQIEKLLSEITFQDWRFELVSSLDKLYLQVVAQGEDSRNPGTFYRWKGRKWLLSPHMTESEIVQTALKAVLTCVEHEAREQFQWKGRAIYSPHISIRALFQICETLDTRKEK